MRHYHATSRKVKSKLMRLADDKNGKPEVKFTGTELLLNLATENKLICPFLQ
jgi:hypothetical protein